MFLRSLKLLSRGFSKKSQTAAVILSGCGWIDGSEITEATSTIISLTNRDVEVEYFAPNETQFHVVNHMTEEVNEGEERNILEESSRLVHDKVHDLSSIEVQNYDMLLIPGGFGVAKNLSNFAFSGEDFEINEILEMTIREFHGSSKPIGACCIAPVVLGKIFGEDKVELTMGNSNPGINAMVSSFGANVIEVETSDIVYDEKNLIVTTPAFMNVDAFSGNVFLGIEKMVGACCDIVSKKWCSKNPEDNN